MSAIIFTVITREGNERGDLFIRSNWIAFVPHAFVRYFLEIHITATRFLEWVVALLLQPYHRYAVLIWKMVLDPIF